MFCASLAICCISGAAQGQSGDTIKVGRVRMAPLRIGSDTFDIDFEMQTPNGPQRMKNVSVMTVTLERRGRDSVLHAHFGNAPGTAWEIYLDPTSLQTVEYRQLTNIDSLVYRREGECLKGWVELQRTPRRSIDCDRFTDYFAGAPIDEHLLARLPLRNGMSGVLAVYAVIEGNASWVPYTVAGEDTVQIGGRTFRAYRIERTATTRYGTVKWKTWVDRDRPRILRGHIDFGNGRQQRRQLRNPG
jgi:hypothetical protein